MPTVIQLKNSVVKDKVPLATDLVIGELAVGANSESPALFFKDNADQIIKIEPGSGVVPSPTPPESPTAGDLWYNEETTSLNYWNGFEWVEIGQAGDSPVTSVNGDTGIVVLDASDVGAVAPGDDISELNNNAGYITPLDIPVSSVNAQTGEVVLDAADVGALDAGNWSTYTPAVKVEDTDLFVISRGGQPLTITGDKVGGGNIPGAPPKVMPGATIVVEETSLRTDTQLIEFSISNGLYVDAGTAAAGDVVAMRFKLDLQGSKPDGDPLAETAYFTKVVSGEELAQIYNQPLVYIPVSEASVTTIAGEENVYGLMTATPGTLMGGYPTISYTTQWECSTTGTSEWYPIAGATGTSYTIQPAEGDKYVRAVTTGTDSSFTPQSQDIASASSGKITSTVAPVINSVTLS